MDQQIIKSTPRDVFMYLFATIALYFSIYSVISLLFDYVNVLFPDALNQYYDPGSSIRWSMALLIIIFPAYWWVSRFLHRDLVEHPEKSEIRIRKWLLYLTLFLAALLMLGDLVTLIYNFLQGEITTRFILKVFVVLLTAGAVFWYYLYDLRAKAKPLESKALFFVRVTIAVLIFIVVGGFLIAGSPFTQRLVRFDAQKISDLQNIQYQVVYYWQQKQTLPSTLDALNDNLSNYSPPIDPQTGKPYDYRPTGTRSFELCGDFNLPSSAATLPQMTKPLGVNPGAIDNWDHDKGRQCFSRNIDPDRYPPITKPIPAR